MLRRIYQLVIYRMVIVSLGLLFLMVAWGLALPGVPLWGSLAVCGFQTLAGLIYAWFLKRGGTEKRRLDQFLQVQFVFDILCITALVFLTGGGDSPFGFAYLIIILLSAIFFEKTSIYAVAVVSVSFYYLALVLQSLDRTLVFDWDFFNPVSADLLPYLKGQTVLCLLTALVSSYMQSSYQSARRALRLKEVRIGSLIRIRRTIVESLPSGLLTCWADGCINFVNTMGLILLGREERELEGVNAWNLFGLHPLETELEDGMPLGNVDLNRIERNIQTGVGEKCFGITCRSIAMESGRTGYLFVFQDLTKIKLLEEQKRLADRMSALGMMAAGVAHEIRNPLAAISGSVQVLKELMPKDETAKELAGIVLAEANRLNGIITQMLAYSRPSTPANLEKIDLGDTLADFARLLKNDEQHRHVTVGLDVRSPTPVILGDRTKLNQVFWNLFRNAVQAVDGGSGRIEMDCRKRGDRVTFSIRDNGKGMTREQRQQLFTPFTSFSQKGTGLGMSIVYDIVTLHRGEIHVESEPGHGTLVTVDFPAYRE